MFSLLNHQLRILVILSLLYGLTPLQVYAQGSNISDGEARNETQSFQEEQVQFKSGEVVLAGTLLRPLTNGAHPAVVIIHGSGPNKGSAYRLYAEQFVNAGIATLLYDKRGSGKINW